MRLIFPVLSLLLMQIALTAPPVSAQTAPPPIEAYGNPPAISALAISPTGSHVAFISRQDEEHVLVVQDTASGETWGVGTNGQKVTQVRWAGPDHVIIGTFATKTLVRVTGKIDFTNAFAINIKTRKMARLLPPDTPDLYRAQGGIGIISGISVEDGEAYMPAYSDSSGRNPPYSLFRVDLDTGRGRIMEDGFNDVIRYFTDEDGTILAQESYSNDSNMYRIRSQQSGRWETVFEETSPRGPRGLVGVMPDGSGLVYLSRKPDGFNGLFKMDYSGEITQALISRPGVEITRVVFGKNQTVLGIEYGGLEPSYEFFDASLTTDIQAISEQFGTSSVRLTSWTDDFDKLVLHVAGTSHAGDYLLFNRETNSLSIIAQSRPDIPTEAIGEVLTIEYKARDGLKIPALLTVPRGAEISNLPMIVMPHGGPESHDQVSFDYLAQYFASRGYMVFQPNFRGSNGFGRTFTEAGYGGWGSSMQHDITDGVNLMIKGGQADPERICIVGWSYGGYAALAGGAFTPDLYQCVASIAGVSHLPQMMIDERDDHGSDHWAVAYWEGAMANGDASRDVLREKSPAVFAENFQAPVLLLHGRDDLVVKINQSRIMRRALRSAGNPVELIEYKGGDHSLLSAGDRLKALQELDRFISTHIGGN